MVVEVLSEIFTKNTHLFSPLYENYESIRRKTNPKYIDAILQARADLYQKYLDS